MDQGWCAGVLFFRVNEGSSNGVELAGRTVVFANHFPGPTLLDGNATARLHIDDGASDDQRRELEAIFQGSEGGPMEILAGLITKWLPTQSARIEIQEDGDHAADADLGSLGPAPAIRDVGGHDGGDDGQHELYPGWAAAHCRRNLSVDTPEASRPGKLSFATRVSHERVA